MIDFPAMPPEPEQPVGEPRMTEHDFHARTAGAWFNEVWRLIELPSRTPTEIDRMIHGAHASRLHWQYVGDPVNWLIGEWQISRVYATLKRGEAALWHAKRAVELAHDHRVVGFHLASAYEGLARALRLYPDERKQAEAWLGKAKALLTLLTDAEEKKVLAKDIESNELLAG